MMLQCHQKIMPDFHKEWIDWDKILEPYKKYENVRIINDQSINPWLFLADLMVTDYGGASLEFICMDKPVVYLDCPEFFDMRGHDIFEKKARETGYIINDPAKLLDTIEKDIKYGFRSSFRNNEKR